MPSATDIAWPYYLIKFNKIIEKYNCKDILKTDCYNEALSRPKYGGLVKNLNNYEKRNIQLLEYDHSMITKAKKLFPDLQIQQGDIRKLPYEDKYFDLVADFSTIDHIPEQDISTTLKEYLRVTKDGGYILLICWFAYNKKNVISNLDKWNPSNQYFLWEKDITDMVNVIESEVILNIKDTNDWDAVSIYANPKYYLKYMLIKK